MIRDVQTSGAAKVVMVTECSMADNVAAENPGVVFVRPCVLCPHMQRITLPKVHAARRAVERMLAVSPLTPFGP